MKGTVEPPEIELINGKAVTVDRKAALGVLKVTPVNLDLKSDTERNAVHSFHQELLDTVTYPLYLYSRQTPTNLEEYVDRVTGQDGYSRLRESYTDYCRETGGFVKTDHFIVIRTDAERCDNTGTELYRRLCEVESTVSGGDLETSWVTGPDLQKFTDNVLNPLPAPTREFCAIPNKSFDEYRKLVYATGYPSRIDFGWPRHVLRVDGLVDVVQVVQPVDVDRAARTLRRRSEKLNAEINVFLAHGHRGVNRLERSLDDVEWFLDLLARQDCQPVRYGAYVTAHAPSQRHVEDTVRNVKTKLRTLRIGFQESGFRNDYAYYTDSPFYPDRLDETVLMPSISAATGFPFGTQPLEDRTGVLYGIDTQDGTPILLDRFSWDSHSMAVIGTLGSGKSYLAHLELLRSMLVYPDLRIIVVDVKKEYSPTVEALGGESRFIEHGKEYSFDQQIVSFEPRERGEFENTAALVELVRQIYSAISKDKKKTLVVIDEAWNLLGDDIGRRVLNRFVLEARDINTAVHMVTQSASHFTTSQKGREILDNVPRKLFFRHGNVTESMTDCFDFSEQEEWSLLRLRSGQKAGFSEALLRVSNVVNTKIKIESTPVEHRIIDEEPKKPQQQLPVIE